MNAKVTLIVSVPLLAAVFAFPCGNAYAGDPPAAGVQATYDKVCKSCHGADGKGVATKAAVLKIDPTKLDFSRAEALAMPREDRKKVLLGGKEKMPAYEKKLGAGDVDPLLDLVDQLQKAAAK